MQGSPWRHTIHVGGEVSLRPNAKLIQSRTYSWLPLLGTQSTPTSDSINFNRQKNFIARRFSSCIHQRNEVYRSRNVGFLKRWRQSGSRAEVSGLLGCAHHGDGSVNTHERVLLFVIRESGDEDWMKGLRVIWLGDALPTLKSPMPNYLNFTSPSHPFTPKVLWYRKVGGREWEQTNKKIAKLFAPRNS